MGLSIAGGGYGYTEADVASNPTLRLEEVHMEMNSWALKYIRTFEMLDKSARLDLTQGYQKGTWTGLINGAPASTERSGWMDTVARLSVNLYGAPPLKGKEYAAYRAANTITTIVGAALAVHLPTGEYVNDRLINLGGNRFTIRPQIGVVHDRYNWTLEAGAAAWFYTENDDFFGDSKLENDPLYVFQSHVIYTWESGLWAGVGAAFATGKQSTVDGLELDDRKEIRSWSLSTGYPLTRDWGIKVSYVGTRRQSTSGSDTDTFALAISHFW